ncbi:MAG: GNAT family N-acetyltransferase [Phycisphaerales bacterium]
MNPAITIHHERPEHIDAIRAAITACFPTPGEARLVDALRSAGRLSISMVAIDTAGRVVGHIAFSPVTLAGDEDAPAGVGLAPLSVVESHRRRGLGAALASAGLRACRDAGWGWCVVLGEPGYYARFGFAPAARSGLTSEYDAGDAFQTLELTPGALPAGAGLVRYAPEFSEV